MKSIEIGEYKIISEDDDENLSEGKFLTFLRRIEYIYRIYFLPIFYRVSAVLFMLFSLILMWSEMIPIFKLIPKEWFDGRYFSVFYLSTILFAQSRIINQVRFYW